MKTMNLKFKNNNFPKVKNFYRLSKKSESYKLSKINKKIIERFFSLLNRLESQQQTIVCTRGDSKNDTEDHNNFFKHDLNKLFTVGAKSNYHFTKEIESIYSHTKMENINILQKELKELIREAKMAINKREKEFLRVPLNYFDDVDLQKCSLDSLLKFKVFLLHFFHTDGRLSKFKEESPFLSVAYSKKKFAIARKFALRLDGQNPREKGFVYLYSLYRGDSFYLKTKKLSKKLKMLGATWHDDMYHEIVLFNGMFPHYILGIFEMEKYKTTKFVMNPYLYDILDKSEVFDYLHGLPINQENFIKYAENLGYKNYFYKTSTNKIYANDLKNFSNPKEVI